ncbi:MAG: class I SAM-dependent methyltransferase [Cyclobacteriaceae bacterium]|nr:class I SAM-dependent methyltransferase [Cyclobacteriaceae bacterium]
MTFDELNIELGNIDIYLLDQLLKGKILKKYKILDAGCGEGRNLVYFTNNEFDVYGVDNNPLAIKMLRMRAASYEPDRFIESTIEEMIFPPNIFDYIISSAVLHFAKNHKHFNAMVNAMVNVLKPKGTLFVRMATDLGLNQMKLTKSGVYNLPDGTQRYLFPINELNHFLDIHGLSLLEPMKTVVVHQHRNMGVMLFKKN